MLTATAVGQDAATTSRPAVEACEGDAVSKALCQVRWQLANAQRDTAAVKQRTTLLGERLVRVTTNDNDPAF